MDFEPDFLKTELRFYGAIASLSPGTLNVFLSSIYTV